MKQQIWRNSIFIRKEAKYEMYGRKINNVHYVRNVCTLFVYVWHKQIFVKFIIICFFLRAYLTTYLPIFGA